MKAIEMRLVKLEKRTVYRGPAAVAARLLTAAEAGRVFDELRTYGDDVVWAVLRFAMGLPPDAEITDDMLHALAAGDEPGLN